MAWQSGYSRTSTAQHQARRRRVLARDRHTCQLAWPGCVSYATIADHVIPVAFGGSDHEANMQAACRPCHDAKTQAEAQRARAAKRAQLRLPTEDHPNKVGG
jgi:5-methylcytosine-specific restriction protein A